MTSFYDRIIGEITRHFPGAKIVSPIYDKDFIGRFGLEEMIKEECAILSRMVKAERSTISDAEDDALNQLSDLEFYREPAYVFIRFVYSGDNIITTYYQFSARIEYILGYKK